MSTRCILAVCMCCCYFGMLNDLSCQNQADPNHQQEADAVDPSGIEINGLVIDKTRTKMGRDFYRLFFAKWEAPQIKSDYIISVSEQPSRGRGSLVIVHVNDFVSFRAILQPRQQFIEYASEQAIIRLNNFVRRLDQIQQNFGNEDLQGSGIY